MNPRVDGPHLSPEDRSSPTRATGAGAAKRAPAPILSEAQLARSVAQYLAAVLSPEVIWLHVPNGGQRDRIVGAQLKAMGVQRGVPDILICWTPYHDWRARGIMWLELKSAKGRVKPEQSSFMHRAEMLGHVCYVCRSIDDVAEALKTLCVPTRIAA